MLYCQKILTKRKTGILIELHKWMGEECCEHTQRDPSPSELGSQCKHWPLFDNPVFSRMDLPHKPFENRSLTHEWEVARIVVRDSRKFILTRSALKLIVRTIVVCCRHVWSIPPAELSWCIADTCDQSHQRNYRGVLQTHVINPTSGTIMMNFRHEWSIPPAELSWCIADACNKSHQRNYRGVLQTRVINPTSGTIVVYCRRM
jgi:hypothetical protein